MSITNCCKIVKLIIVDSQLFRAFGKMIIFSFESIPAKNHHPDSDGSENSNDDDPDDRVIDVFFTGWINMNDRPVNQEINNGRRQNQPDNS